VGWRSCDRAEELSWGRRSRWSRIRVTSWKTMTRDWNLGKGRDVNSLVFHLVGNFSKTSYKLERRE
jgi:hypothetical protein